MRPATGTTAPDSGDDDRSHPPHLRLPLRAIAILALCVAAAALLSLDVVQAGLARGLAAVSPAIAAHP
ncbi:MAG: hypothetical protein ACOY82_10800, partial [Pseudomonadota bacterium]